MLTTTKNTLQLLRRDKDTLEVKEVIDLCNTLTLHGENAASEADLRSSAQYIGVSPVKVVPNLQAFSRFDSSKWEFQDGTNQDWQEVIAGNRIFWETDRRFNAPAIGTTRTVNTVFLTYSNSGHAVVAAYASLDTEFVQTESEVLDIIYRIEFVGSLAAGSDYNVMNEAKRQLASANMAYASSHSDALMIAYMPVRGDKDVNYNGLSHLNDNHQVMTDASNTATPPYYEYFETSLAASDRLGQLFKSYVIGDKYNFEDHSFTWGKLFADNFPNKPVQVIHNHGPGAFKPFTDVNHLASGSGAFTLDGSNWNLETPFADWYYINIDKEGDTGTGAYTFSAKRGVSGFSTLGTYNGHFSNRIPWFSDATRENLHWHETTVEDWKDFPWVTSYDLTGFSILNLDDGRYTTWSAGSATAIQSFSEIGQLLTDNAGGIWVADRVQGLYYVQNPTTSTSIVKMSVATNGIPSDDGCFGVCQGYNNRVWAVFDGGISFTDDSGASWTNLGTSRLDYSGSLVDGDAYSPHADQSRILQISCDMNSNLHHLCLLLDRRDLFTTEPLSWVWWSLSSPYVMKDKVIRRGSLGNGSGFVTAPDGRFMLPIGTLPTCSRKGGFWTMVEKSDYSNNVEFYALKWGVDDEKRIGLSGSNQDGYWSPCYWYDINDEPSMEVASARNSTADTETANSITVVSRNGKYSQFRRHYSTSDSGSTQKYTFRTFERWQLNKQAKLALMRDSSNRLNITAYGMQGGDTYASNVPADSFGGKHTKGRDYTVFDYKWNPGSSQFELEYSHPATDTSATNVNGIRSGFDVQDHTFTGRSRIDVSHLLASALTGTDMTFCATIVPEAEEHYNGTIQTLMSLDSFGLYRDTLNEVQDNAIYWNQRPDGREGYENADNWIRYNMFTVDASYAPSITVHTAGPVDNVANPVRVAATLERTPLVTKAPQVWNTNPTVIASYAWDDATRSISWSGASAAAGSRIILNVAPNVSKEYTDFSLRYRIGDDFHDSTNRQSSHILEFGMSYARGHLPLNHQLAIRQQALNVRFRVDGGIGIYSNFADAGNGGFSVDDKSGVNLIDMRCTTTDSGLTWNVEVRRVVNPGPSETYVTLYTTSTPYQVQPEYAYKGTGGHQVASFTFDIWQTSGIGVNSTLQFYKDLDIKDNVTGTSIWDAGVTFSQYDGKVYLDGVLHSETTWFEPDFIRNRESTPTPMSNHMCNPSHAPRSLTVGADRFFNTHHYYRGIMKNVQLWNVLFDSADIAEDNTQAGTGDGNFTATKPSTNLVGHYPLTESLDGMEAKATHTAPAVFDNALEIAFTDQGLSPAWSKDDFYTFAVTDGLLKDDATSLDLRKDVFTKPATIGWSFVESSGDAAGTLATTVPAASTNTFWEPVTFTGHHLGGSSYTARSQVPGQIACSDEANSSNNAGAHLRSFETLKGDGQFRFKAATADNLFTRVIFSGVPADLTAASLTTTEAQNSLQINFEQPGVWSPFFLDSPVLPAQPYSAGDVFELRRTGSQYVFYQNGTAIFNFDPTGVVPWNPTGEMVIAFNFRNTTPWHTLWYDVALRTYKSRPELQLGNSVAQLGRYSPNYSTFAWQEKFWEFNLDGAPPTAVHWYTPQTDNIRAIYSVPDPAPGEIAVLPYHGVIIFNPADTGKNFQVNCVLIERA